MKFFLRFLTAALILSAACAAGSRRAEAVVGQAERFSPFEQKDLDEFHQNIVNEEQSSQFRESDELRAQLKSNQKALKTAGKEDKAEMSKEVELLKQQLLSLPKRKLFHAEVLGQYQVTSNANGVNISGDRDSDSIFYAEPVGVVDLSGRNTTLNWELGGGKQWNIHFPNKDFWQVHETLRYRRKYFKKIFHSANSTIGRQNAKTVEVENNRVRWDSAQGTAFNYAFSPNLSLNSSFNLVHRYFPQEAFDQDSSWQSVASPSLFWNATPKSRISAGYNLGTSRIRTKTGNTISHEVHGGYFGRITRKSSASLDLAFSHQVPKSTDTGEVNTMTTGIGYIWQMTPKTQLTTQLIRAVQFTTSSVPGDSSSPEDDAVPQKTDSHFTNNSITFTASSRLNQKLLASVSSGFFYLATHTAKETAASEDSETSQIGIPVGISVTYFVRRWLNLTMRYNYNFKSGDEITDKIRTHVLETIVRLIF